MAATAASLARRNTRYALNDLQKTETTFDAAEGKSSLKLEFSTGSVHLDLVGDETRYLTGIGDWLMRNKEMNVGGDI